MHVENAAPGKLPCRFDLHGAGVVASVAPLRHVIDMRAPAGDHPAAVTFHLQPAGSTITLLRMHPRFDVWYRLGGSEPHLVVQVVRNRTGGGIAMALVF